MVDLPKAPPALNLVQTPRIDHILDVYTDVREDLLYDAHPKAIIAGGDLHSLEALSVLKRFRLLTLTRRERFLVLSLPNAPKAPEREIIYPPTRTVLHAALSTESQQYFEGFRDWWARHETPPTLVKAEGNTAPVTLVSALLENVLDTNQELSTTCAELHGALYQLRKDHAETKDVLAGVREHLSRIQAVKSSLAMGFPPEEEYLVPPADVSTYSVRQYVPLCSRGITAVELFPGPAEDPREDPSPELEGCLSLALIAPEDKETLGLWTVPFGEVDGEPLYCELMTPDSGVRRSVELQVTWQGNLREAPRLALSTASLFERVHVRTPGSRLSRPLALNVHTALPGGRINAEARSRSAKSPIVADLGAFVSVEKMARARLVPYRWTRGHPDLLTFIESEGVIQLHPVGPVATHALIPSVCASGTRQVIATVHTAHPNAPAVEYAMYIAPCSSKKISFPDASKASQPHSGWYTVEADSVGSFTIVLDTPLTEASDLHIATRLAPGVKPEYAWARWVNFQVLS